MCAKEFDIFMRRQMDILHRYNLYLKQVERIVRDKQVPQVNVLPRAKLWNRLIRCSVCLYVPLCSLSILSHMSKSVTQTKT